MTLGWVLLVLFLAAYFVFAGAIVYHLKVYAFSKTAKLVTRLFLIIAISLSILSLVFFYSVNWQNIFSLYA